MSAGPIPSGSRRLVRRAVTAVVVLLVGAGLGVGAGLAVSPSSPAGEPALQGRLVQDRTVVVLGGGTVPLGQDLLDVLAARGTARVVPGASYGSGTPPLGQAVLDFLPDPDLDLLAVQGGELDVAGTTPASTVELGAVHLVDRVRAGAGPGTALVLVGPVPDSTDPGPRFLAVRAAVRSAAASRGVPFLDPVLLGWTSSSPSLAADLGQALIPFVPVA